MVKFFGSTSLATESSSLSGAHLNMDLERRRDGGAETCLCLGFLQPLLLLSHLAASQRCLPSSATNSQILFSNTRTGHSPVELGLFLVAELLLEPFGRLNLLSFFHANTPMTGGHGRKQR